MKFEYWVSLDLRDRYMPTLHTTRQEAREDVRRNEHLEDATFVVAKVRLVRVNRKSGHDPLRGG